jgi:hypothetical protein
LLGVWGDILQIQAIRRNFSPQYFATLLHFLIITAALLQTLAIDAHHDIAPKFWLFCV